MARPHRTRIQDQRPPKLSRQDILEKAAAARYDRVKAARARDNPIAALAAQPDRFHSLGLNSMAAAPRRYRAKRHTGAASAPMQMEEPLVLHSRGKRSRRILGGDSDEEGELVRPVRVPRIGELAAPLPPAVVPAAPARRPRRNHGGHGKFITKEDLNGYIDHFLHIVHWMGPPTDKMYDYLVEQFKAKRYYSAVTKRFRLHWKAKQERQARNRG